MRPTRRSLALALSTAAAGALLVLTPTAAYADGYQPTSWTHQYWATCQAWGQSHMLSGQYIDYQCRLDSGTPGWDAVYRLWLWPRY
ncbi:hypothetical protein [Nonomuraea sp. NEAU-A123]|uniref:hypothetical protein n=1 Tax=Nonomuraea sp. NEAU-A123 TaxID=2839649 RepID=UPI001BE4BD59|nr:hypothetical protein [Nonomuraea sp. NEAU-A123]MBT2225353.1 hypothetical protein [Nonomuraea sp. NEAU-A123]